MTVNSILFIFTFLPILLLIYKILPAKYRNCILIGASLLFYAWGEPIYVFVMLLSMGYTYWACLRMDDADKTNRQRKSIFLQIIIIHVFMLLYLKYYGFILDTMKQLFHFDISYRVLPQPLGVSFYIFMILSYVIDVYTHKIKAEKNLGVYAVYVTFFPKLLMGPLERFGPMKKQILAPDNSMSLFTRGVERFITGLAKKVILADSLGLIWNEISLLTIPELSVVSAWIGAIAYTLQIYYDFSGYTDMAIGIGNMFGFKLMENFRYPYLAISINDFWRRWHISLSAWFRDYIYIPLGGNRGTKLKHICNVLIVWGLTGLWHGANWTFIMWGFYYGILLLLEKYVLFKQIEKLNILTRRIFTFLFIVIGWVFFASNTIGDAFQYLSVMFGLRGNVFFDMQAQWFFTTNIALFVIAFIAMGPYIKNTLQKCKKNTILGKGFTAAIYGFTFLVAIAYLVSQTYQSFLYIQF